MVYDHQAQIQKVLSEGSNSNNVFSVFYLCFLVDEGSGSKYH